MIHTGSGTDNAGGDAPDHTQDLNAAVELWEQRRQHSTEVLRARRAIARQHVEDLRRSGLSDETIRLCRFFSMEGDEVGVTLNWKGGGGGLGPCLVIPFFGRDYAKAGFGRVKPDNPMAEKDGEKVRKYEQPKVESVRPYIPPTAWPLIDDHAQPLLITEGEKKSCKAVQEGFACVGLTGVDCGYESEKDAKGRRKKSKKLHPDLKAAVKRGRRVFVVFDTPDTTVNENVRRAGRSLLGALKKAGAVASALCLPECETGDKVGLDDFLMAHGREGLLTLIAACPPPQPTAGKRPTIEITPDEHLINDLAIAPLSREPNLYSRGGYLVRVLRDRQPNPAVRRPAGAPRVAVVAEATLREDLTRAVEWVKENKSGNLVHAHPPGWCVKAIHARGEWPGVRPLAGVVESPMMRPDGTILDTPGYDPATGLLYEPSAEFPPLPPAPSREDATRAAGELLDLVADFPFVGDEHKAVWLAGLLTVFARPAVAGPCPLFLFEASAAGSGKTLLSEVVGIISAGREPPVSELSNDNEEVRKAITAILLEGERLVLLDNANAYLGCAALDAVLTATTVKGRILGKTQRTADLPADTVWFASGNNIQLRGDTHRRTLPCRLEPLHERPEERSGFKIADLKAHVREHRPRLVVDALTVLRAYFAAGRPQEGLPAFGSFEAWSLVVRQAVRWATGWDPCGAREVITSESRGDSGTLAGVLAGWSELPGGAEGGLTASAAVGELAKAQNSLRFARLRESLSCWAKDGPLPDARQLGNRLKANRGRVAGGFRLVGREDGHLKVQRWLVEAVAGSAGSAGSCSNPSRASSKSMNGYACDGRNTERPGGQPADPADPATDQGVWYVSDEPLPD